MLISSRRVSLALQSLQAHAKSVQHFPMFVRIPQQLGSLPPIGSPTPVLGAVAKRYKTSKAHNDEGKPSKGDVLAVDGRRCCLFHLMGSSPTSVSRISDPIHGE